MRPLGGWGRENPSEVTRAGNDAVTRPHGPGTSRHRGEVYNMANALIRAGAKTTTNRTGKMQAISGASSLTETLPA